ncbi:MAG: hypothetical protein K2K01_02160, partial [Eubacterium sp.]|nr:hypothetical protein [Eubacterium sp.]
MDPSTFRVTDTAVKIDTTNLDGWYVYDHYYDQNQYNLLGLSDAQKLKQPYRAADNTYMNKHGKSLKKNPVPIQDVFVTRDYGNPGANLYPFNQHAYTYQTDDKANMVFAGYGTQGMNDFMFYPATSDSRRTIEFDLDCSVINPHTLHGFGFLLNAAIDNKNTATANDDILNSYILYYTWPSTVGIYKINDYNLTGSGTQIIGNGIPSTLVGSTKTLSPALGQGVKLRMRVVLEKDKVTVSQRTYNNSTGALGDEVMLFNEQSIPVNPKGGNGFGPFVGYTSHGCEAMTAFVYGDLSMTYSATAFDALKNVQYANTAQQKYFVNLVGDSNDPNIPDEKKESQKYIDGINRMNDNEIFYLSNAEDGKVLTESTKDESGNKTHTGLGSDNGYIATDPDNYIEQLAKYIYDNYTNKTKFTQAPVESALPLANFYITNTTDPNDVSQLMTVHQKHLPDGFSVKANIFDKSKVGSADLGAGDKLVEWTLNIYDPEGNVVKTERTTTTKTLDDGTIQPVFSDFEITNKTLEGRYTFELVVKDNLNKTSETFQTYL